MIATFEQIQEMENETVGAKTTFTLDSETIKGIKAIFKGHKKTTIQVLNCVLVEVVNKNVVKVTYSDSDIVIEKMFLTTVNDIKTRKFLIPIEVFKGMKYIKKNELFTFVENDDKFKMEVIRNSVVQEITIGDFEDYPQLFDKEEFKTIETSTGYEYFDKSDLKDLVKATKSVSDSESRPVLQNVVIQNKKIVSTDSHRLYMANTVFNHDETILIQPALVQKANELIPANTFMKLSVSDRLVKITDDMTTNIYARQMEGNFPDTSRLIPQDFYYEIKINEVKKLHTFLKGLGKNSVVKANINSKTNKLEMESKTETGSSKIDLPIDIINMKDDSFKISFSSKYFMEGMEQLDLETISVNFVSNMRPFILKKVNSEKELALVLPVRTY